MTEHNYYKVSEEGKEEIHKTIGALKHKADTGEIDESDIEEFSELLSDEMELVPYLKQLQIEKLEE